MKLSFNQIQNSKVILYAEKEHDFFKIYMRSGSKMIKASVQCQRFKMTANKS